MPTKPALPDAQNFDYDVIIVGSGAAGLTAALKLVPDHRVCVLSKAELWAGSTNWAQGGIAAALEQTDSPESHVEDTLIAGAGLCRRETVEFVAHSARAAVEDLINLGVPFDKADPSTMPGDVADSYHLTREGGHSHRRILHSADRTGRAVQLTLDQKVLANPMIDVLTDHIAVDIITNRHLTSKPGYQDHAHGVYVLSLKEKKVKTLRAPATILATGGASRVYVYSSNPDGATGDGIALAWRAGCRVTNMEFNQFHPTCLYHPEAKTFLITEAMRGEGAILLGPDLKPFMHLYDQRADLAPRDIVARAIDNEMKRHGVDHLWLDISHRDPDFIVAHFPTIYRKCQKWGIDITRDPIPIVPAAHYTCGGIEVDKAGRTDLAGLYAIGECAHTGLHGANRMASNSLLECFVFAASAADHIRQTLHQISQEKISSHTAGDVSGVPGAVRSWDESQVTHSDELVVISHNWMELRRFMWDYVGIVRTNKRLERAKRRIDLLQREIFEYYGHFKVSADLLELRNLVTVADLIVRSALKRQESRGLHYSQDYPDLSEVAIDTILTPLAGPISRRVD